MDVTETGATPDVEVEDTNEIVQEESKSMEDTIADTLREIEARSKPEDSEDKAEVDSKPIAKVAKKKPVVESPAEVEARDANTLPPDVKELVPEPPNTWKKEAKAAWVNADPAIKAEVARREADFHKGIEQYKGAAEYARSMDNAMTPYKATLQKLGITPDRAIAELMGADHKLRYGADDEKHAYFMQLAHTYGINLDHVANQQRNIDPRLYNMELENQQLKQQMQYRQQQEQAAVEGSLNNEIQAFAADPKNAHFETVKGHMAALLQAGQAKDLPDAYEQAIYANPQTRMAVIQQQQQAAREEAAKKAQAARMASSVNVRSRPALPTERPVGSMDETIRDAYRRLSGTL